MAKAGRPKGSGSKYTEHLADEICRRLSAGETLRQICKTENYPAASTVVLWQETDPAFAERYSRARRDGLDAIAEEIIDIADTARLGEKVKRVESKQRVCSECEGQLKWQGAWQHAESKAPLCPGATAEIVYEEEVTSGDMVERARLQVDARKWLLSKMRPDKYGDRTALEHTGAGGAPLSVTVEFVKPKE